MVGVYFKIGIEVSRSLSSPLSLLPASSGRVFVSLVVSIPSLFPPLVCFPVDHNFHFTKWFPIKMVPWYLNYMHANMSYYRCCTNREKANTFLLSLIFPKWADIFTEKKITCSPFCLEDAYASLGFAWYFEHNPHLFIDGLVHDCVFAVEIL